MNTVSCQKCRKEFKVKPSWIKAGYGKYCSSDCRQAAVKKGKMVKCTICEAETYKSPKALRGSKSGKYFCSKSCQTKWRNQHFSNQKHPNFRTGKYAHRTVLLQANVPQFCRLCNTKDTRVLAVHHIDHNHLNNSIENLVWLCHNCHHLVHHDSNEHERFMATIV